MPPVNPAEKLNDAPIADLIVLLFKQFNRLLREHDITLTSDEMQKLGDTAAEHATDETILAVRKILITLVDDSLKLLKERWNLSYAESLAVDMVTLGGWETTSDFLEIANDKSNAELRISAGASLLVGLGEARFVPELLAVIDDDAGANDIDATIARRMLNHTSGVQSDVSAKATADATDWRTQIEAWYHAQA